MISKFLINTAKSFQFAFRGIPKAYRGQRNIKIQSFFAVFAFLLSYLLRVSTIEFLILLIIIFLVIILEIINTSVERVCDLISKDYNKDIKDIKDMTAGAVLLSAILSVIVGILIFSPYLWRFIK